MDWVLVGDHSPGGGGGRNCEFAGETVKFIPKRITWLGCLWGTKVPGGGGGRNCEFTLQSAFQNSRRPTVVPHMHPIHVILFWINLAVSCANSQFLAPPPTVVPHKYSIHVILFGINLTVSGANSQFPAPTPTVVPHKHPIHVILFGINVTVSPANSQFQSSPSFREHFIEKNEGNKLVVN